MRIVIVSPLARIDPEGPRGYMGIERAAFWLATEFAGRQHEVTLAGNVDDGPSKFGWTGLHIDTESDVLSPGKIDRLLAADAVSDWTHLKFARMVRAKKYSATVMWTDVRDEARRNVYPSEAVREAFKDPSAPVVPIGLPVEGVGVSDGSGPYVALGRLAPYKGQDLAVRIAKRAGVKLTVAGHTGFYADAYFSLTTRKACADAGFEFVPDPPDLDALLDGAAGLVHTHRWLESFSIVAAQALVRGVPVLTTDQGAVREWVVATDGGVVLPLKDLEEGKLDGAGEFFERNWSSRRAGIAKRARELFDVRGVADRYLAMWEKA